MIPYLDISKDYLNYKKFIIKSMDRLHSKGRFIQGEEIKTLEKKLQDYLKVKYCLTLNSGTDALLCALYSLNLKPGDEIITTPNTWYSTVAGIMHLRLVPKFVDIGIDQNMNIDLIEKNISNKTKAILVVHLNGKMLDVKKIKKICDKYNIRFIEDSAQCFGGSYDNIQPGQLSDVACFSTHPTKTFFSHRDGGFLVTNNKYIYEKINKFRNHGTGENERDVCDDWGVNSRFDNLQATILIKKLKDIDHLIKKRQKNANFYLNNLDPKLYILPSNNYKIKHTFQFFVLHTYNPHKIINYMLKKKIELRRYFHIPMYKQNFFKKNYGKHKALINSEAFQATSLNLPIHHNLSRRNLIKICNYLNRIK
jgi:dTDP-4-amino-4,6-dideoxygalactose transaminase